MIPQSVHFFESFHELRFKGGLEVGNGLDQIPLRKSAIFLPLLNERGVIGALLECVRFIATSKNFVPGRKALSSSGFCSTTFAMILIACLRAT